MTRVKFITDGKNLIGFEIRGHSSKSCDDESGKIVCAAVSSAAYMAANTVIEIIGDVCEVKIDDAEMIFEIKNPSDTALAVLNGFKIHIKQLSEQYSNNIKVYTEV